MTKGIKDFVAEAKANVETISPEQANTAAQSRRGILLDVREPGELTKDGKLAADHIHIPRGLLEAKADPDSGVADAELTAVQGKSPVMVVCASGARAAMAAARLKEMGYDAQLVGGGLAGWKKAGLPTV
ncbi:hypothetical protein A3734_17640 [Sulfitobacter sp. HI0054]|uniref:rhodanese-like domain-containing protein n=1 Tax=Sulfitobacter sp. HI0054 TaxID=1822238 RepID=UPI0007C30926|nr:rhodanese-like domain-containing protein [Sulfitobacter sp. HI0054]KZY52903.1 hypothetical protein A3734_17640 [Sulfitobacter sp. HI0054]MAE92010.1 sulfurtransferase [Pelagibaca sp.]